MTKLDLDEGAEVHKEIGYLASTLPHLPLCRFRKKEHEFGRLRQ